MAFLIVLIVFDSESRIRLGSLPSLVDRMRKEEDGDMHTYDQRWCPTGRAVVHEICTQRKLGKSQILCFGFLLITPFHRFSRAFEGA